MRIRVDIYLIVQTLVTENGVEVGAVGRAELNRVKSQHRNTTSTPFKSHHNRFDSTFNILIVWLLLGHSNLEVFGAVLVLLDASLYPYAENISWTLEI
jgi:hypothetical protein